ncbi:MULTISPECIES: RNA 2',3'-cyclic phosphodiesterase [Thalassobaculum]|uniref:RNA 2',3'-cyclic phosphodiesterase n=1 Tax=Thalassobaculum litoreum DSM 18839 TaxID=1123362 RepID=A0A8G2EZF6_9PROT|nr:MULTISPECIES: RNA 2',3'-cyclic phosphodiesterase [Thalassobaculum]SDG22599.1 2'-5' RNA ligase [Thalassobaculum litoreum DSM 18839]
MTRLFVALDLPETVKDALGDLQVGLPEARWHDIDDFHLTLRFIGEVDPATEGELVEALDLIDAPAVTVTPLGYGHFERKGKPAVLYVAAEPTPELVSLQRRVESLVRGCGVAPDPRRFTPHVTLARFPKSIEAERVGRWLETAPPPQIPPFTVDAVTLYRSRRQPDGARYEPQHRFPLDRLPDEDSTGWSGYPQDEDGDSDDHGEAC